MYYIQYMFKPYGILCYFSGEHIHRRLYRPKGSTDQDSASGVYAVSLQQWPQAEGVGLLQEGDSPGTVEFICVCTFLLHESIIVVNWCVQWIKKNCKKTFNA